MDHTNPERKPKTEGLYQIDLRTMSNSDYRDSFFVSRIATRESSTLTFATVGASSSLVVLALVIDRTPQSVYPWLSLIGMLFSILGIIYREATFWSIDKAEYEEISDELHNLIEKQRESIRGRVFALIRRVAVRFFLWVPFIAWLTWFLKLVSICAYLLLAVFLLVSVMFSLDHLNPQYRVPKSNTKTEKSGVP